MFRRNGRVVTTMALATTLFAGGVHAQAVKNGTVSGVLVSATAAPNTEILLLPADKVFVLTQFCTEDPRSL